MIKDIRNKIIQNPLYDKVEIIPHEKVTLYENNNETTFTSYNLYDAVIEKRLFYLNNELLTLDLRIKGEPKFRENLNQLLHKIKNVFLLHGLICGHIIFDKGGDFKDIFLWIAIFNGL